MDTNDVAEIVQRAEVDPAYYSLGEERDEALCLVRDGPEWVVFISQRGDRYEIMRFLSEDGACTYFLKRLFEVWHR